RGQLRSKRHEVMSGQALAIHDGTPVLHPHRVKHALGDIDPEYAYLLLHWTRLLWCNGCNGLQNHCGSSKPIRTGGGSISLRPGIPFFLVKTISSGRVDWGHTNFVSQLTYGELTKR